jgi:hypothetical protein
LKRWIAIALTIGLFVGGGIGYAAANCADSHCIFVPNVRAAGENCDALIPYQEANPPGYAWLTKYTVVPGEPLNVCAFVSYGGPQVFVYTIIHQRTGDIQTEKLLHDGSGPPVTQIAMPTERLTAGELIGIDVLLDRGGTPELVSRLTVLAQKP